MAMRGVMGDVGLHLQGGRDPPSRNRTIPKPRETGPRHHTSRSLASAPAVIHTHMDLARTLADNLRWLAIRARTAAPETPLPFFPLTQPAAAGVCSRVPACPIEDRCGG